MVLFGHEGLLNFSNLLLNAKLFMASWGMQFVMNLVS